VALAQNYKTYSPNGFDRLVAAWPEPLECARHTQIPNRDSTQKDDTCAAGFARRAFADVRLPCMLYAAVGAVSFDAGADTALVIAQTRRQHGVLHVISYDCANDTSRAAGTGLAVVTRGYWYSRKALARLMAPCGGAVGMFAWHSESETLEADAHVTRGTAQFVDGHLHLWFAAVDAGRSRARAAHIAGISQDLVDLRVVGQPRSEAGRNVLVSAIALARALQPAPVQVIVAQDFEHHPESSALRAPVSALAMPGAPRTAEGRTLVA